MVPTRTIMAGINPVQLGFRPIRPGDDADFIQQQQQMLTAGAKPRPSSNQDWPDGQDSAQPRATLAPNSVATVSSGMSKKRDYFAPNELNGAASLGSSAVVNGTGTAINKRAIIGTATESHYDKSLASYSVLADNNVLIVKRLQDDMRESELVDYVEDGSDSLLDSMAEMEHLDGHMRIFIALFDYDPDTMSPNSDAGTLELAFKEGQLLRVIITTGSILEPRHIFKTMYSQIQL